MKIQFKIKFSFIGSEKVKQVNCIVSMLLQNVWHKETLKTLKYLLGATKLVEAAIKAYSDIIIFMKFLLVRFTNL